MPTRQSIEIQGSLLWRLKINCNNSVGAGFPRPHPLPGRLGGENPPLRCCCIIYSKTITNFEPFSPQKRRETPRSLCALCACGGEGTAHCLLPRFVNLLF